MARSYSALLLALGLTITVFAGSTRLDAAKLKSLHPRGPERGRGLSHKTAVSIIAPIARQVTPSTALDVQVSKDPVQIPTDDGSFKTLSPTPFRVVEGTGGLFEGLLATTPQGRILDLGAGNVYFSDNRGATWSVVPGTSDPLFAFNGKGVRSKTGDLAEGAILAAPGGDIVGLTWQMKGDLIFTYKYVGSTAKWYAGVAELHRPADDRPWISVLKGPFHFLGQSYDYATWLTTGADGKEIIGYVSFDGINYFLTSLAEFRTRLSQQQMTLRREELSDPDNDWIQPHYQTWLTPLPHGRALYRMTSSANDTMNQYAQGIGDAANQQTAVLGRESREDNLNWFQNWGGTAIDAMAGATSALGYTPAGPIRDTTLRLLRGANSAPTAANSGLPLPEPSSITPAVPQCTWAMLQPDFDVGAQWTCVNPGFAIPVPQFLLADSNGLLHRFYYTADADGTNVIFHYDVSQNGGNDWTATTQTLPGRDWKAETPRWVDFQVNGKLGVAAMAFHAVKPDGFQQTLLYKIENTGGRPTWSRVYFLGDGKGKYCSGALCGARFDFESVAILPDGKLAATFADSVYGNMNDNSGPGVAIEVGQ